MKIFAEMIFDKKPRVTLSRPWFYFVKFRSGFSFYQKKTINSHLNIAFSGNLCYNKLNAMIKSALSLPGVSREERRFSAESVSTLDDIAFPL